VEGSVLEGSIGDPMPRSMSVSAPLPLLSVPTDYDALVFIGVVEPEDSSVVIPESFWKRWCW
jgi:hypothetical protein